MVGFASVGARFESTMTSELGLPFKARIQPIEDSKIYPDDFFQTRQIMRIRPHTPIVPGDVVCIGAQRFLLGALDNAVSGDIPIYTSFQMYPCNKQVTWKRETTIPDPLTRVPRSTGLASLGNPWVLMETLVRDVRSSDIRTNEELKRVITGSLVELGDVIDGMVVKKLNITRGVRVLEVV